MRIIVAGGTGFLGTPLVASLRASGHDVIVLSRHDGPGRLLWTPDGHAGVWASAIDGADAVINLAGEGIADRRWSAARKRVLRDSRILATRGLVSAIRQASRRPAVFVSGSAIGYYGTPDGPDNDVILDESSPPGSDFLATLCVDWESEARAAEALGCRVVLIRTGIVLSADGGALAKLLPPFRFFAGGPIASGRQWMSWIQRDDWIALARWTIETPAIAGAVNASAPGPVTNRDFSAALGRALHRPSWIPVPALALRLLVGEIAPVALVRGQRALPRRAEEHGFHFQYAAIDAAMQAALRRP